VGSAVYEHYHTLNKIVFFYVDDEQNVYRQSRTQRWYYLEDGQMAYGIFGGDSQIYCRTSLLPEEPAKATGLFVCDHFDQFYISYKINDVLLFKTLYEKAERTLFSFYFYYLKSFFNFILLSFEQPLYALFLISVKIKIYLY